MRRAQLVFAVLVAAVLVFAAVRASGDDRGEVQSTGVITTTAVANLDRGAAACQRPLVTLDEVSAVLFRPGLIGAPTRAAVVVRDDHTKRILARGPSTAVQVGVPVLTGLDRTVPAGRAIAVCVVNRGPGGLGVYGDDGVTSLCVLAPASIGCRYGLPHPISSVSSLVVDGHPARGTLALTLVRPKPRSLLSDLGGIFERASTFRPGFVGPALWWILLVLVCLVAPAAVWWALGPERRPDA
jgi:hypothetical protein